MLVRLLGWHWARHVAPKQLEQLHQVQGVCDLENQRLE